MIATTAYGLKIQAQQDKSNKFVTMANKLFDAFEFNVGYVFACEYIRSKYAVVVGSKDVWDVIQQEL